MSRRIFSYKNFFCFFFQKSIIFRETLWNFESYLRVTYSNSKFIEIIFHHRWHFWKLSKRKFWNSSLRFQKIWRLTIDYLTQEWPESLLLIKNVNYRALQNYLPRNSQYRNWYYQKKQSFLKSRLAKDIKIHSYFMLKLVRIILSTNSTQ